MKKIIFILVLLLTLAISMGGYILWDTKNYQASIKKIAVDFKNGDEEYIISGQQLINSIDIENVSVGIFFRYMDLDRVQKKYAYQSSKDVLSSFMKEIGDFAEYISTSSGEKLFVARYKHDNILYLQGKRYIKGKDIQGYYDINTILYEGEHHLEDQVLEFYDSLKFEYSDPFESFEDIEELRKKYGK